MKEIVLPQLGGHVNGFDLHVGAGTGFFLRAAEAIEQTRTKQIPKQGLYLLGIQRGSHGADAVRFGQLQGLKILFLELQIRGKRFIVLGEGLNLHAHHVGVCIRPVPVNRHRDFLAERRLGEFDTVLGLVLHKKTALEPGFNRHAGHRLFHDSVDLQIHALGQIHRIIHALENLKGAGGGGSIADFCRGFSPRR